MSQNRASMVITAEVEQAVMAAIAQIESLLKGLTALVPGERKKMRMMGPKGQPFVADSLELIEQNRAIAPASLDVDEMRADFEAYERMKRINVALKRLTSLCVDTQDALGSDAMDGALTTYNMLKVFGPMHGLTEAVKKLGERFTASRKKRKSPEEPDAGV